MSLVPVYVDYADYVSSLSNECCLEASGLRERQYDLQGSVNCVIHVIIPVS